MVKVDLRSKSATLAIINTIQLLNRKRRSRSITLFCENTGNTRTLSCLVTVYRRGGEPFLQTCQNIKNNV